MGELVMCLGGGGGGEYFDPPGSTQIVIIYLSPTSRLSLLNLRFFVSQNYSPEISNWIEKRRFHFTF